MEEVYTEMERGVEAVGDQEDLPARPRAGRPGVLELFVEAAGRHQGARGLLGRSVGHLGGGRVRRAHRREPGVAAEEVSP
eukprot:3225936-Pyramimonas_sp.AAC.1